MASKYLKPDEDHRRNNGPKQKKKSIFDLPDGTQSIGRNQRTRQPINDRMSSSVGDLPSGYGKKQAIENQRRMMEERKLERQGTNDKKKDVPNAFSSSSSFSGFSSSLENVIPDNSKNLEKNVSKFSVGRFYLKEIGYYLKPVVAYLVATLLFVLLGALGLLNGIDLRIASTVIYGLLLFIAGIFVNRYMSVPGFIILAVTNVIGGVIGHAAIIANLPVSLSRLAKIMNIIYYCFDTESVKLNSVVLVISVVAPVLVVYLGSRLHKITYIIRAKLLKIDKEDTVVVDE